MKRTGFIFFFFIISVMARAQADSCSLRISLLTCAPGNELYSTFGHTAIRVQKSTGQDLVFNYGTFEYSPDFYSKFIRGKLLYSLSVENFDEFLYTYQQESRSVIEQELAISCAEKEKLLQALLNNAQPEKRKYRYDFLFDNCTTRARDITEKNAAPAIDYKNILPQTTPSFRQLLHTYLDKGHQPWNKLGIDILLGVQLDKKVNNRLAMFLPDYLMKGFDSAFIHGQNLVSSKKTILEMPSPLSDDVAITPGLVFWLLLALIVALSFLRRHKIVRNILLVFDFLFFFALGLAGVLLVFMWTATDHVVCRDNFNLLWALPSNLIAAFVVHNKKRWATSYFFLLFWFNILLAMAWFFLPQQMNPALFPVVLLIIFRTWYLFKEDHNVAERTRF